MFVCGCMYMCLHVCACLGVGGTRVMDVCWVQIILHIWKRKIGEINTFTSLSRTCFGLISTRLFHWLLLHDYYNYNLVWNGQGETSKHTVHNVEERRRGDTAYLDWSVHVIIIVTCYLQYRQILHFASATVRGRPTRSTDSYSACRELIRKREKLISRPYITATRNFDHVTREAFLRGSRRQKSDKNFCALYTWIIGFEIGWVGV